MRLFAVVILISTAAVLGSAATAGAAPANDAFAAAAEITGMQGDHVTTTFGATKEPGEPNHAGNAGGRSIWYTWTAPETGTFVFHTFGSSFDTLLAVYTGTDIGALTEVASSDDDVGLESTRSRVAFVATEGTFYAVALDGFGGKAGRARLAWHPGPANDLFAHPTSISSPVGSVVGTNVGATVEHFEPTPSDSGATIWFEWTAPDDETVKFSTFGTHGFDTVLGVYTGDRLESLTTVGENDDDPEMGCCTSFVGFDAVAGTVYRIALGGWGGGEGKFTLSWSPLVRGTTGDDLLVGTPGVDEIRGLAGNDVLQGLGGDDLLLGGAGNDRMLGGTERDTLIDRRGRDILNGGPGNDFLDSRDLRTPDRVDGGVGRDRCLVDRRDVTRRCP